MMRWIVGLSVMVLASGCGPSRWLKSRFAADTGCDESVTARDIGAGLYEVRGCGIAQRYVCAEHASNGNHVCVRDREQAQTARVGQRRSGGRLPPPTRNAEAPNLPTGVRSGRGDDGRPGVRLVLQDARAMVVLTADPSRDPEHVAFNAYSRTNDPLECDETIARNMNHRVAISASDSKLTVGDLQELAQRSFLFDFCGRQLKVLVAELDLVRAFLEKVGELRSSRPAAPPADDTVPAPETADPEATVRAAIDARKRAISGCLGAEPGAVVAEWDAEGAVVFSASGAPEDADVQGCVRAAMGTVRVRSGEAGRLMHPVE